MSISRLAAILVALLALFVAVDNMQRPLAHPDEGRYSEISREMAASGDWVTPRLNGIKYFEKPPLQYWASAAAFSLLGESEFTARIYTALCGLIALLAVGYTARRLAGGDAALLAVGVLLSSPYFLGLAGVVTLDMGLTAWTTVAVCAFLLGASGPEAGRRRWFLLAWAGMALAVLSKGLIGIVFPAAAIFLHCLANRDWRLLAKLEWWRGTALFLLIAAPWFVLVSMANPEFPQFFFVHEHFERFLSKSHRREEPWWYFWPILFAGFLPWMLGLVPAALEGWRREGSAASFPWRRFALLWSAFILAFFSASSSKLPAYILPVFPVFALVLGDWLARTPAERLWKGVAILAPFLAVLVIAAPWFVLVSLANPEFPQFFFVHEHFERFLSKSHRREEPWWYFWPILFAGFLPWMLNLVPAALDGWRRENPAASFPWRRFALVWSAFILAFFSASSSKLPAYILPVFPVLALVLGDWLARAPAERLWKPVAILVPLLVVVIAVSWGAPERARNAWTRELYAAARPWIVAGLVVLAAALAASAIKLRAGRKWGALATMVAATLLFVDFVEDGYERLSPRQSGKQVAGLIARGLTPATRLYSVGIYDQTVPFYLKRTLTLVAYYDEFSTGIRHEPQLAIPTLEAFAADWVRPGEAMAIIHPDLHEQLSSRGLAMNLLHRDERRILVRKP
ncbi:MAG TPA: phospholipid carrier-dependent glycosyltransferase [Usitatibacteraceae bacterium]|nr:phospholipid carrier-dependent glycosyltransferase [Usitatibacteraceae bacterium]